MDKAQQILDWFTHAEVLAKDNFGRLVLRDEDMVMELYIKDIEIFGYDDYLDDIRSMAGEYVKQLKILIEKIDSIVEEENKVTSTAVIRRIAQAAPFTGKSALNQAVNND